MAKQPKQSQALNLNEAFTQTALSTLRALCGADKQARHDAIVVQCGVIAALALCREPPKGYGNPADHAKVSQCFTDASMPRYADAALGFTAALRRKGMRSIDEWDTAQLEGFAMADAMLSDLRPKVYSKAEQVEREAKRETKKAEREAAAKAESDAAAAKVLELHQSELSAAYARGRVDGRAEVMTGQNVADAIKLGQFSASDLQLITDAIRTAPVDVQAREVALLN